MQFQQEKYSDLQFKVFDWLRFPLVVGVVFIHCFGKPFDFDAIVFADLSATDCYNLFRVAISRVLTHICVPIFFLISGYLFFIKLEKWDNKIYLDKLKKRCKTLLIPFLIWNSFAIVLSLIGTYRHEGFLGIHNFFVENGYWRLYWDCNVWNVDRLNWMGGGQALQDHILFLYGFFAILWLFAYFLRFSISFFENLGFVDCSF